MISHIFFADQKALLEMVHETPRYYNTQKLCQHTLGVLLHNGNFHHNGHIMFWLWVSPTQSGGRLNKKDGLTRYGDSHVKDKTS